MAFALLAPAFFFVILPAKAQAGFLSFAKEVEAQTQNELNKPNTQTVSLLEGFSSPSATESSNAVVAIDEDGALVPATGPLGTAADLDSDLLTGGEISLYVVHEGDSLAAIAKMFGVSVNTIRWANDLVNGQIKAGDTLIILPISGVQYEIKKGDTLESIAKKFGGDVTEIRLFNGLTPDQKLAVGDSLIIPDGELSAAPTVKKPAVSNSTNNGKPVPAGYYVRPVQAGSPWRKSQGFHGRYSGIDLAAPTGTPLVAAADGVVLRAKSGWNGGYGQMVIISHPNGTQTIYAHLSKILVNTGDKVAQGQLIGKVGSTGKSTGPHLHFEIRGTSPRPILSKLY